ncbi:hypothetical protein ABID21_002449 [Pseudorhizobium tarimense]|uniref:Uncharacterized protein n=1 Tax=Pseudorhizobium tarimense TaxID=1079109 RepID=A0ABV2H708_9HYPH|nr:hypothetical protein [Pseudorhizobium tarimense]MCJ8519334.1 hypothetical protein [Pseudorhizobium tarimense]
MAVISFEDEPNAAKPETAPSHPLRPVFIGVLAAKVVVAAFLLATVSMAPPVSAEASYYASLN